jgi:hypothetical protein
MSTPLVLTPGAIVTVANSDGDSVTVARVGITVTVFPEPEVAAAPVFAVPEADPDGPDAVVAVAAASEAAENAVIPVDLSADAEPAPDVTGSPEPADGV